MPNRDKKPDKQKRYHKGGSPEDTWSSWFSSLFSKKPSAPTSQGLSPTNIPPDIPDSIGSNQIVTETKDNIPIMHNDSASASASASVPIGGTSTKKKKSIKKTKSVGKGGASKNKTKIQKHKNMK